MQLTAYQASLSLYLETKIIQPTSETLKSYCPYLESVPCMFITMVEKY